MPVNVPRLQPIQPSSNAASPGRIEARAQDQSRLISGRTNTLVSLGDDLGKIYQDYEDRKIDQLSTEAEQEYSAWNVTTLEKLKKAEGDPTQAFAQYDEEEEKVFNEILQKRGGEVSERVQRHVASNLAKSRNTQRIRMLQQRGLQQEVYDNNLFEAGLKKKREDLTTSASVIRVDDDSSFLLYDENLSAITTSIAKRGLRNGTAQRVDEDSTDFNHAYRNEDGEIVKVKMSLIAKQRVAKEVSEGVTQTIEILLANGEIDKAKKMKERYAKVIDAKNEVKLVKKINKDEVKNTAFQTVGRIETKPEAQRIAEVDKIKDPEVKSEVLKILDANTRRRENLRERKQKRNYNRLANHVLSRMDSDRPFYGLSDLENDPLYKQTWDNLSPKQKTTVKEMVESPKKTNPKAEIKMQDLLFGRDPNHDINTITPEDFATYLTGLNDSDRKKYRDKFLSLRQETASETRTKNKRAEGFLRDELVADGFIDVDDRGRIEEGDFEEWIKARNALIDHLDDVGGTFDDKQLKDFVNAYSRSVIEDETFRPKMRVKVRKRATGDVEEIELTDQQRRQLKRKYYRQFRRNPRSDDPDFRRFVQEEIRKREI